MSYSKQTSIDKPLCPEGHGKMTLVKTWELKAKGGKSQKARQERKKETGCIVELYRCSICRITTRKYRKLPKKGEKKQ